MPTIPTGRVNSLGMPGPQGIQGEQGPTGPTGPDGPAGDRFDTGDIDVTGVTDSTAALQAVVQPTDRPAADAFGDNRITVDLPRGAYIRITAPITITRPVHIRGNGARIFCDTVSGLTDMFVFEDTAISSMLEDCWLLYAIAAPSLIDNSHTAVKVECFNFQMRDVTIDGAGYGLVLDTEGDTLNLNSAYVENCWAKNNRRAGLYILGTDVSASSFIAFRTLVSQNYFESVNGAGAAKGIYERSANGSTYVGCHVEISDEGIVIQPPGGIAPSTFIGQYVEEGDGCYWRPANGVSGTDYSGNTTVVGGHMAYLQETRNDRVGARSSQLTFRQAYTARMSGLPTLVFANSGSSDTITRSAGPGGSTAGSWIVDGFRAGMTMAAISGTTSNNGASGTIVSVTDTVLTFGAGTSLTNETKTNSQQVIITATDTAFQVEIPAENLDSAMLFKAEDSSASSMLWKFDGATAATERWKLQAFLAQSKTLLGTQLVDNGGGNYDVEPIVGPTVPQVISGTGSWGQLENTIFVKGTGARTITIPVAAAGDNFELTIVDFNQNASSSGNITLSPSGSGTINGVSTFVMSTDGQVVKLRMIASSGANGTWLKVN